MLHLNNIHFILSFTKAKKPICRHPIFDRPQDLDVTVGTLGDYPLLVFVWSSRRSRLRALPQISELDRFVSGFAPNTCVLPWRGRECLVRHPHTSPAMARGHRLVFCCHRQYILPVGILCCRSAVHFVKMAILSSRLLFVCFCRYFAFCSPPYTCMEGWPSC